MTPIEPDTAIAGIGKSPTPVAAPTPMPRSQTQAADGAAGARVLELIKVGKRYGSEPAVDALVDVDLIVERGEWLAITGPSGAGKSTLLNVIGCLDHPSSGRYLFEGLDTANLT